jgi:hypothetical protein
LEPRLSSSMRFCQPTTTPPRLGENVPSFTNRACVGYLRPAPPIAAL